MGAQCSRDLTSCAPPCDPTYPYFVRAASTRTRNSSNIGKFAAGSRPKKSRKIRARAITCSHRHVAINALPDNVLLEIFDICRLGNLDSYGLPILPVWEWNKLVHVCQRWRRIVFASPRRLDLELFCTHGTPVRKNLGYWPTYPIIVDYFIHSYYSSNSAAPNDDVIAALEHPDRVRRVEIVVTSSLLGKMATVMQKPFTELTHLRLSSTKKDGDMPVLPGAFLALPTLLSSASDLVTLRLDKIPQAGYISPEAMVAGLAALTRLITLSIRFESPTSRSNQRRPAPLTRVVLAAHTFDFYGVCEYLEELAARIDAPQLTSFEITYFNQLDFQVPQLSQLIARAENYQATLFESAYVGCGGGNVNVHFFGQAEPHQSHLSIQVSCQGLDWQISSMTQLFSQASTMLSSVRHVSIEAAALQPGWQDDMDHNEWLKLLRPFIAVKTLRICRRLAGHVSLALEDTTEATIAGVLPLLHSLYLEEQAVKAVERFTAARQRSGRPVGPSARRMISFGLSLRDRSEVVDW